MHRWWIIAAAVLIAAAAVGRAARAADEPAPAPAPKLPADAPAPGPDDEALRDALKSLAKALEAGDRDGIARAMYAANPTEQKMLDAMAVMALRIAELHQACVKAFGAEDAVSLTGDIGMEVDRIDRAEIEVDGDTATVRYASPAASPKEAAPAPPPPPPARDAAPPGQDVVAPEPDVPPEQPPMVLKKVDGRWRVPIAELSKDTTAEEIEQRLADLDTQSKIIGELTGEIALGKYKSADKAAEAWQGKMMQALTPPKKQQEKPEGSEPPTAGKPDQPEKSE
jgi:hypothetical protein